ncbi:MAG TPA: hypothetical protein PKI62_04370 [bacterium]|nr:hypothetical protein [bacterium]HPR87926.1 hypothetical protein [bacterium]
MKHTARLLCTLLLTVLLPAALLARGGQGDLLPESWRRAWETPPAECRPLQIVHGADIRDQSRYYKESCGLGGVVCNVPFGDTYLRSAAEWQIFVEGVRAMLDNGLRVWIYDEDGYPSLAAGGGVLQADPSLQSLEMVYDRENPQHPFQVRPCYEFTHASNNFYAARKYPNPLDPRSTQQFIALTHQAYRDHLGPELFGRIEAFFSDEPSMMGLNLGQLRESVRKNVRVIDPLDPGKKNLPMISWAADLPERYRERYGQDLMAVISSLFSGDAEEDRVVRQQFWSLLADLDYRFYYKAIQEWLRTARLEHQGQGPVASGHGLREENPLCHVPLDGNKLLVSRGFDIPGLDQLSSDPAIWAEEAWMAVAFPASAAALQGQRRVMCEMSDFDQTIHGRAPANLAHMQAAAAWQMAFGVTDFNLYYTIVPGQEYPYRGEKEYQAYCTFVGRVNALLKPARPLRRVVLYYPIYDLQREYHPVAEKMDRTTQNERAVRLESSFTRWGGDLLQAQIPFTLADAASLEKAAVTAKGSLRLGDSEYSALVFPEGITLPGPLRQLVDQSRAAGVAVVLMPDSLRSPAPGALLQQTGRPAALSPADSTIAYGEFEREGRRIFILVNTGNAPYTGELRVERGRHAIVLDPAAGGLGEEQPIRHHAVPVQLPPLATRLLVTQ